MQFFLASLQDHEDAWQRYLKLTRLGGTASYAQLAEAAGMKVPFTSGSLTDLAKGVEAWIEEHQL